MPVLIGDINLLVEIIYMCVFILTFVKLFLKYSDIDILIIQYNLKT